MSGAQESDLSPREALELLGHRVTIGAPTPVKGPGSRSDLKGRVVVRAQIDPPVRVYRPATGETVWSRVEATCLPAEVEARLRREFGRVLDERAAFAEHELELARRRLAVAEGRAEEARAVIARVRRPDDG